MEYKCSKLKIMTYPHIPLKASILVAELRGSISTVEARVAQKQEDKLFKKENRLTETVISYV